MFVCWKREPVGRRFMTRTPHEPVLYAALFESQRVNGKRRQRMVRCLAAMRGGELVYPTNLNGFWRDVDLTLADLKLDDDDRRMLETTIAATLPRPDASDVQQRVEAGTLTTAIAAMCARRGKRRHPAVETVAMQWPESVTFGT